jgi:transposase
MQAPDKPAFVRLVTDVLAYYRQNVSEFTLSVWWQACQPFDMEQVRKALTAHATDAERGQFAPKVADVVRILQGTTTDRAALAWGKVHEAMSAVGAYQDVVFDDPAIHAAVEDCGGWPTVCRTELSELSYLQHRFSQAHKAYTGRGEFDFPRRLTGDRSPDAEYEKKGLPLPRPAIVGDRERARLVYRNGGSGKTAISFLSLEKLAAPAVGYVQ